MMICLPELPPNSGNIKSLQPLIFASVKPPSCLQICSWYEGGLLPKQLEVKPTLIFHQDQWKNTLHRVTEWQNSLEWKWPQKMIWFSLSWEWKPGGDHPAALSRPATYRNPPEMGTLQWPNPWGCSVNDYSHCKNCFLIKGWNIFWSKLPFLSSPGGSSWRDSVLFVFTLEYLLEYCDEIAPEPSPLQGDETFSQKRFPSVIPQSLSLWLCHPRARTLHLCLLNFTQLLLPTVPACPGLSVRYLCLLTCPPHHQLGVLSEHGEGSVSLVSQVIYGFAIYLKVSLAPFNSFSTILNFCRIFSAWIQWILYLANLASRKSWEIKDVIWHQANLGTGPS